VTDYAGWCVFSLDFVHVLNTHWWLTFAILLVMNLKSFC
jgi:hypothetical protein